MKKMMFLLGLSVGFMLGSRAGRRPYEQVESTVRGIAARRDVRDRAGQLRRTASSRVGTVAEKLPWPPRSAAAAKGDATATVPPPHPVPSSYADPQDLQFSTAVTRKQEMVDELLEQGVRPEQLDEKEQTLRQAGVLIEPSAGNKPEPAHNG